MQAIFIPNPRVRMDRPWGTPYVPLELLSVMAVAEHAGMATGLFDVNQLIEDGQLLRQIPVGRGRWAPGPRARAGSTRRSPNGRVPGAYRRGPHKAERLRDGAWPGEPSAVWKAGFGAFGQAL